jgi:alkylresorcinol/alkylpyrone synthase
MTIPAIAAVGTAVPGNPVGQEDIRNFAAALFREGVPHLERLMPVFQNASIEARYLAQPLDWYATQHNFSEANALYEKIAFALSEEAAIAALDKADIEPGRIGAVLFVSSTGIATPTLDSKLIQTLGLSNHAIRLPIWGLGCAGGVSGIARAAELAALTEQAVLLIAVELCSLTFQRNDFSKSNLVGSSIFGDGAAAVVLAPERRGPVVLGSYSTLFPETEDIMGWDMSETGLKVRFSRDIPAIVHEHLPALLKQACAHWGIQQNEIRHFIAHPGGAKVLSAYSDSLELAPQQLSSAYQVLREYGNMSSASVLFVLKQFMAENPPTGDYGVMLALGPGFSAEQVLFRW